MKSLRSIIILIAILGTAITTASASKDSKLEKASYWVSIHCGSCQQKLMDNLRFEKGVKEIQVNVETKQVDITYNSKKTDSGKLQQAIEKLGYEVRLLNPGEELKAPVAEGTCCGGHANTPADSTCKTKADTGHKCTGNKEPGHSCAGQKSGEQKSSAHTCSGSKDPNHKCSKAAKATPGCSGSKETEHKCEGKKQDANTQGAKCNESKAPQGETSPSQGHKCNQGQH